MRIQEASGLNEGETVDSLSLGLLEERLGSFQGILLTLVVQVLLLDPRLVLLLATLVLLVVHFKILVMLLNSSVSVDRLTMTEANIAAPIALARLIKVVHSLPHLLGLSLLLRFTRIGLARQVVVRKVTLANLVYFPARLLVRGVFRQVLYVFLLLEHQGVRVLSVFKDLILLSFLIIVVILVLIHVLDHFMNLLLSY